MSFLGKLNLPEAEDIEVWKIQAVETLLSNIRSVSSSAATSSALINGHYRNGRSATLHLEML